MSIDLPRLMRLRLVVARYGEMDMAKWWNSKGMLGQSGTIVLKRGFPQTFPFVQAKVVFAVARSRCEELFNPPNCMTLWNLPAEIEERFEDEWHRWLEHPEAWEALFQTMRNFKGGDLLALLEELELLTPENRDVALKLTPSAEGNAVPVPGVFEPDDNVVTLLAAGFRCSDAGTLRVPYARLETA